MSNGLINRQYVGARYVPKIMGEWNKALQYEALSVVTYMGNSFTSKVPVPANVEITNEDYWINTGNYNAQIEEYKNKVLEYKNEFDTYKNNIAIVTPYMFGAKGNGIDDDTEAIRETLKYKNIFIPSGTFLVKTRTDNTNYNLLIGSNTTIVMSDNATIKGIPNNSTHYVILAIRNAKNVTIIGGNIVGDKSLNSGEWGYGINIYASDNVLINNVKISNCLGDSININGNDYTSEGAITHSSNIRIINCELFESRRQGISVEACETCLIDNNYIHNISGTNPGYAIDIEKNIDKQILNNITISNLRVENNMHGSILVYSDNENTVIKDCALNGSIAINKGSNMQILNVHTKAIGYINCVNATIKNCSFNNCIKTNTNLNNTCNYFNCTFTQINENEPLFECLSESGTINFHDCTFIANKKHNGASHNISLKNANFYKCFFNLNGCSNASYNDINIISGEIINCIIKSETIYAPLVDKFIGNTFNINGSISLGKNSIILIANNNGATTSDYFILVPERSTVDTLLISNNNIRTNSNNMEKIVYTGNSTVSNKKLNNNILY